jgi:fructose-1,6-bisphosphatase/inositol monophosphatase family enzyme
MCKLLSIDVILLALHQVGSGALDLAYVACGRVDAVYSGVAGEGW